MLRLPQYEGATRGVASLFPCTDLRGRSRWPTGSARWPGGCARRPGRRWPRGTSRRRRPGPWARCCGPDRCGWGTWPRPCGSRRARPPRSSTRWRPVGSSSAARTRPTAAPPSSPPPRTAPRSAPPSARPGRRSRRACSATCRPPTAPSWPASSAPRRPRRSRRGRRGRQPEGPKRSVRIDSTGTPTSANRSVAASQNPGEPHTNTSSPPRTSGARSATVSRPGGREPGEARV